MDLITEESINTENTSELRTLSESSEKKSIKNNSQDRMKKLLKQLSLVETQTRLMMGGMKSTNNQPKINKMVGGGSDYLYTVYSSEGNSHHNPKNYWTESTGYDYNDYDDYDISDIFTANGSD